MKFEDLLLGKNPEEDGDVDIWRDMSKVLKLKTQIGGRRVFEHVHRQKMDTRRKLDDERFNVELFSKINRP